MVLERGKTMKGIYMLGLSCFGMIFLAHFGMGSILFVVTLFPGPSNPFTTTLRELGAGNWYFFNDLPIFVLLLTAPVSFIPVKIFVDAIKGLERDE